MNIFLDDIRQPKDVTWVELPLVEWIVVKNYNDFTRVISSFGVPTRVTFDHDLADEHYQEYVWNNHPNNINKGKFRYDQMKERTGYDCAKWLVYYCIERGVSFPEYYVHTLNPIGKENIISYIENFKKSI